MIIKSMSRKEASFSQLYDYMKQGANRKDDKYHFNYNCFGRKREEIIQEFEQQANYLGKRKNGVYLYHEIISISRTKNISTAKQKEILSDIVKQYIQSRAKNNLVSVFIHDEKDNNLHFHLMISANEIGQSRRYSLRKKQFDSIKRNLELWILEKYPELEQRQLISKKSTYKDDKENLIDFLQSVFSTCKTRNEFHAKLSKGGYEYKVRGNTVTFINIKTKAKHRLKTLDKSEYGLLDNYEKMQLRLSQKEQKVESSFKPKKDKKNSENISKPNIKREEDKGFASTIVKEWVFGDFEERDKRIAKEAKRKKYQAQNEMDDLVPDKNEQTKAQVIEEAAKEWIFGDFSARDARARKEASKKRLKEWRKNRKKSMGNEKGKSGKKQ